MPGDDWSPQGPDAAWVLIRERSPGAHPGLLDSPEPLPAGLGLEVVWPERLSRSSVLHILRLTVGCLEAGSIGITPGGVLFEALEEH